MALRIKSLTLKRFRSVISSELKFDNPTFLIGRNGAGKSNVVDALNFLADALLNPVDVAFDRRGGIENVRNRSGSGYGYPPNLGLRLSFEGVIANQQNKQVAAWGDYAFEIKARKDGGFEIIRERCYLKFADGEVVYYDRRAKNAVSSTFKFLETEAWKGISTIYLLLAWLRGVPTMREVYDLISNIRSYSIDPSEMRKPQDHEAGFILRSNGSNAGNVLRALMKSSPAAVPQICELLAQITPNTSEIRTVKHGKQLTLEFQQQWDDGSKKIKFEAYSASDGTLRALGILIALMQAPPASLLIIEEPESSLHPGALDVLLQLIQNRSAELQIVVTTHSSEVLDAKWINPENLRLVTWSGGTDISPISGRAVRALKSHLATAGELMRANALEEPLPVVGPVHHQESNLFPEHK